MLRMEVVGRDSRKGEDDHLQKTGNMYSIIWSFGSHQQLKVTTTLIMGSV